jgi:hypothetical protein
MFSKTGKTHSFHHRPVIGLYSRHVEIGQPTCMSVANRAFVVTEKAAE